MTTMAVGENIAGKDSRQIIGDSELLESLVDEANSSLESLSLMTLDVDQVQGKDSAGLVNAQTEALIRLLPRAEMEELAQRIRNLEALLLDIPQ